MARQSVRRRIWIAIRILRGMLLMSNISSTAKAPRRSRPPVKKHVLTKPEKKARSRVAAGP